MNLLTVSAPAYWASSLLNGDDSGMEETEIAEMNAWLKMRGLTQAMCIECEEEAHFGPFWFEVQGRNLGADLLEYTFDIGGAEE